MAGYTEVARLDEVPAGALHAVEADGEKILLAHVGDEVFATQAVCPHYKLPLAKGVLHGRRVICAFHHAVFDVTDGNHDAPPGCGGLRRYPVKVEGGAILVDPAGDLAAAAGAQARHRADDAPVFAIVGAGTAGDEAAATLRHEGFTGRIVLIGREDALPYDRTALSKAALKAETPQGGSPLRDRAFYEARDIELMLGREVAQVDAEAKTIIFADGERLGYDACLLATGGLPRRLPIAGADLGNVFTLRTPEDADAIVRAAEGAKRVVLVGSSFIALEAAAALGGRGLAVTVVAPDEVPLTKPFGAEVGRAVQRLHESKGVTFRLGRSVERFEGESRVERVVLDDGDAIPADLALMGVGVRPATDLLRGLDLDDDGGVPVDAGLKTSIEGLFAAGDVARFPLPDGRRARIEHWRLAAEHGRVAARSMLGQDARYGAAPYFWSAQHQQLRYVGHAEGFDEVVLDGDPDGPFIAFYLEGGRVTAALGVKRDPEMAAIQLLMDQGAMPAADAVRGGFDPLRTLTASG